MPSCAAVIASTKWVCAMWLAVFCCCVCLVFCCVCSVSTLPLPSASLCELSILFTSIRAGARAEVIFDMRRHARTRAHRCVNTNRHVSLHTRAGHRRHHQHARPSPCPPRPNANSRTSYTPTEEKKTIRIASRIPVSPSASASTGLARHRARARAHVCGDRLKTFRKHLLQRQRRVAAATVRHAKATGCCGSHAPENRTNSHEQKTKNTQKKNPSSSGGPGRACVALLTNQ